MRANALSLKNEGILHWPRTLHKIMTHLKDCTKLLQLYITMKPFACKLMYSSLSCINVPCNHSSETKLNGFGQIVARVKGYANVTVRWGMDARCMRNGFILWFKISVISKFEAHLFTISIDCALDSLIYVRYLHKNVEIYYLYGKQLK